jgi:uncharacterized protein (DUF885 family)
MLGMKCTETVRLVVDTRGHIVKDGLENKLNFQWKMRPESEARLQQKSERYIMHSWTNFIIINWSIENHGITQRAQDKMGAKFDIKIS